MANGSYPIMKGGKVVGYRSRGGSGRSRERPQKKKKVRVTHWNTIKKHLNLPPIKNDDDREKLKRYLTVNKAIIRDIDIPDDPAMRMIEIIFTENPPAQQANTFLRALEWSKWNDKPDIMKLAGDKKGILLMWSHPAREYTVNLIRVEGRKKNRNQIDDTTVTATSRKEAELLADEVFQKKYPMNDPDYEVEAE